VLDLSGQESEASVDDRKRRAEMAASKTDTIPIAVTVGCLALLIAVYLFTANSPVIPTATDQTTASQTDAARNSDQATSTEPPKPEDVARANAPQSELALFDAQKAFEAAAEADAPNNVVRDERMAKGAVAWRKAVASVGEFSGWAAYTAGVDTGGDGRSINMVVELMPGLRLDADIPPESKLYQIAKGLTDHDQPVYISGRFTAPNLIDDDDNILPTCFEEDFLSGCAVELTDLGVSANR
jgi:hypothetical protein